MTSISLASKIISLTVEAQREIEELLKLEDYHGATFREAAWREQIELTCAEALEHEFS